MNVYLSPSVQEHNEYAYGKTVEEAVMNKVADVTERELIRHGVKVKCNTPDMNIAKIVKDSNAFKADVHVAIHSNAGGGHGCVVFSAVNYGDNNRIAVAVNKYLAPLTVTDKDKGVAYVAYDEIRSVKCPACLAEVEFHDNPTTAKWILDNIENIGIAIAKGILEYGKIAYKAPVVTPTVDYAKLYTAEKTARTAAESKLVALQNSLNIANDKINKMKEFVGGI